jgi:predicted PurR-regulated permease PerM
LKIHGLQAVGFLSILSLFPALMDTTFSGNRWLRVLVGFGSLVVIVAALYFAQEVLVPVVMAVLLTFILSPLVKGLQRLHVPRLLAVLVVVILSLSLLSLMVLLVYSQIKGLAIELPERKPAIVRKVRTLLESGRGSWLDKLFQTGRDILQEIQGPAENKQVRKNTMEPVPTTPAPSSGPIYLLGVAHPALRVLLQAALIVVLLVFMLLRREDLRNRLIRLSGEGNITRMTKALDDAATRLSRFLLVQLCINLAFGILATVGLWLIGVPYALVWGLLAGLLRYLPYLGAYVGTGLTLIAAAFLAPEQAGWTPAILTLILFLGLELITANVIEPGLFGHSIGVSEVALLVAAAFWAWLWGPIGLLLSTPLTACLAVLGRYVPQLEFFDVLLGNEPVLTEPVRYYQRLLARDEDEAVQLVEDYLKEHDTGAVFEKMLLPALLLTSANRESGRLTEEDEQFIIQTTREVIEDLPADGQEGPKEEDKAVLVLGYPARHPADELALLMLGQLLGPAKCRLELLASKTLASEVLVRVEKDQPAAVCIASLSPHGLTAVRYLCKRLRAKLPDLKLLVLSLGREGQQERVAARLRSAGADNVATSLSQCRDLLAPIVQLAGHQIKESDPC